MEWWKLETLPTETAAIFNAARKTGMGRTIADLVSSSNLSLRHEFGGQNRLPFGGQNQAYWRDVKRLVSMTADCREAGSEFWFLYPPWTSQFSRAPLLCFCLFLMFNLFLPYSFPNIHCWDIICYPPFKFIF